MYIQYLFLSACLLQRQSVDYARVREYSLRVLKWRPGDVKALYRAGVAALEMGDAQTSKQYLIQACREQPNGKQKSQFIRIIHKRLGLFSVLIVIYFDISVFLTGHVAKAGQTVCIQPQYCCALEVFWQHTKSNTE